MDIDLKMNSKVHSKISNSLILYFYKLIASNKYELKIFSDLSFIIEL